MRPLEICLIFCPFWNLTNFRIVILPVKFSKRQICQGTKHLFSRKAYLLYNYFRILIFQVKNIIFDGDWTHNLLIYSQTLYHCATEAYYKLESILYILSDCSLFINILIIFLPITFLNHVPPTQWVFNPYPLHLCLSKPFYSSAYSSSFWFPAQCWSSFHVFSSRQIP